MEISFKLILFVVTIFLTGLTAGLCFTWGNAVTPGLSRLDDLGYLQAFQAMNRAIINPTFLIVFMGPTLLHIINVFLFKNTSEFNLVLIISAAVLYFFGLFLVTVLGNVPINEILDNTDLLTATAEELAGLREQFEVRWSRFHMVRTISASLSFILLIISLALSTKIINI